MRRLLRDIAEGRELGDVTTLRDPSVWTAQGAGRRAAEGLAASARRADGGPSADVQPRRRLAAADDDDLLVALAGREEALGLERVDARGHERAERAAAARDDLGLAGRPPRRSASVRSVPSSDECVSRTKPPGRRWSGAPAMIRSSTRAPVAPGVPRALRAGGRQLVVLARDVGRVGDDRVEALAGDRREQVAAHARGPSRRSAAR